MIVYCHMMSWVGSSVVSAEHYYAWLECKKVRHDLTHVLTQSEADRLNRREPGVNYVAGGTSSQFFDEERLKRAAIEQYKKVFPGATLLVYGDQITHEPQPILDGPLRIKSKINELADAARAINWWEDDEDAMQIIQDEWKKLWELVI